MKINKPLFKVVLDERTKKADDTYPLKLRVTYKATRRLFGINENLTKEDWDLMHSSQTPLKLRKLRTRIGEIEDNANNCAKEIPDFRYCSFV